MQNERLAWPDVTRALGVLAVVLFHSLIWNLDVVAGPGIAATVWDQIGSSLGRIRMPILFGLAGLLAASGLARGWGRGSVVTRLVSNAYLYLVWLVLYGLFFLVLARPDFPHSIDDMSQWLRNLYYPTTTLWFIFALALYPVVLVGLRTLRFPPWLIVVVGAALWGLGTFTTAPLFGGALMLNFVFFALGVFAGPLLRSFAEPGILRVIGPLAVFLVAVALGHVLGDALKEPFGLIASASAIPLAIACAARICRWAPAARLGALIGARTLPIYLLHVPLLGFWSLLSYPQPAWLTGPLSNPVIALLYPLLLTTALVSISLAVGALLRRIPGDPLLSVPSVLLNAVKPRRRAHR
ncbi:acyltransferase [Microbacteriaceae bacterium VKM Ac-2855]|nr:acyltransferase [Microbacteriaceae bacterium VKM Ac-2855]